MFDPWVRKICWRRKWNPTLVFLPGESSGQRSLVGYSQRGHRELDTSEQLNTHPLTTSKATAFPTFLTGSEWVAILNQASPI